MMTNTHRHRFRKQTDEEILRFITKKVSEGFYDLLAKITNIEFQGDFNSRLVIIHYESYNPFYGGN